MTTNFRAIFPLCASEIKKIFAIWCAAAEPFRCAVYRCFRTESQQRDKPTPSVRALHGLTLNIRGITPAKWVAIQELPIFSSLDYIILTAHQLSAEFRPDKIIKSGWDYHAISGTVTSLPRRGYQGHELRGQSWIFFSTTTRPFRWWRKIISRGVCRSGSHQPAHAPKYYGPFIGPEILPQMEEYSPPMPRGVVDMKKHISYRSKSSPVGSKVFP